MNRPHPILQKRSRLILLIFLGEIFLASGMEAQSPSPTQCPNSPVVNISSSQVPIDVCIPSGFSSNPIAFFDDFSWRSFIALVWPVLDGQRGVPDPNQQVGGPGPRVFETFKAQWEIFHPDGSAPVSDWNQYDTTNPCSATVGFGDLVLAAFTKYANVAQAGQGTLVGPLIAQNKTYVRYATGFNKTEFSQIVSNKWYLRANIPNLSATPKPLPLSFPTGALDIKSSWIDMTGIAHPERYYTRTATVKDPYSGACAPMTVGLVGLHIVQKTPTRPQWIWSTFEQIDNIPQAGAVAPYAFSDGTSATMPANNPNPSVNPLPSPMPTPFNLQRLRNIHVSTQATNAAYQKALGQQKSVWQFYQLVMTQWPTTPSQPNLPGTPANTFPGASSGPSPTPPTAFSNLTMETFDQTNIRTGCMACHNITGPTSILVEPQPTDFLWALQDHAFDPNDPDNPTNVPDSFQKRRSFQQLKALLQHPVPPQKSPAPKPAKSKKTQ